MKKDPFIFNYSKEFASFCLEKNTERLVNSYMEISSQFNEPLLDLLTELSENELSILFQERLHTFLNGVINDNALIEIYSLAQQWKEGKFPVNANKYKIQPTDILLGFTARKNALLKHLPEFTRDSEMAVQIVTELNTFNLLLEEIIFKTYVEIQQEVLIHKNESLQHANSLLQQQMLEKIETEKKLRKEKDFNETLINNTIDGIIAFDKNLTITAWNKALEQVNGLPKERVIGKDIFDVFPIYRNSEEGKALVEVLQGKRVRIGDVPLQGKRTFFEADIIPLFNENNEITGGLSIIRDLTERRLAESKIRSRELQLKEAQEIAHLGSWEWNSRSKKIVWSDEMFRLLGYVPGEITLTEDILQKHMELIQANEFNKVLKESYYSLQPFCCEVIVTRKDKAQRILYVKGKVTTHNRNPFKITGIAIDITERKQAEEEVTKKNQALELKNEELSRVEEELKNTNMHLEQRVAERTDQLSQINTDLKREITERQKVEEILKEKNMQLIKMNTDLDNFIYTASHDLKAPISNIEGLITALAAELPQEHEEANFVVAMINQSIRKFKETIQDLTEITKTQKGIDEDETCIDIALVVEEIKISIGDMIRNTNTQVQTEFFDNPEIRFSKANFKSILYNLISNAIKYRHPERFPQLDLKFMRDGKFIVVVVKDNGLGIPESQKEKIFTMFKRLHDHVEGSGVGLYIVKRIVENNGGRIEVESEVGAGSLFRVYLKAG